MSVERLPSSSHECYILTGTAVHHSMLYQLHKHCVIKVLMRLLPATTVHTSHLRKRQQGSKVHDKNTQHLRGSEIRRLPITADTRHQTFTVQEMDFVMYLLQLARYVVHVYMAICAHYHYICNGQLPKQKL